MHWAYFFAQFAMNAGIGYPGAFDLFARSVRDKGWNGVDGMIASGIEGGEIYRVLRVGGRYCITDLRHDVHSLKKAMVYLFTQPKEMRPGLVTSLNAAYTVSEITELLRQSDLHGASVTADFFGICVAGEK